MVREQSPPSPTLFFLLNGTPPVPRGQLPDSPFFAHIFSLQSDRKTRTAALTSLQTFLSAKHISTSLQTLDILKLWKGLFYALWMCDRPLPQQQLCSDLAALTWVLPDAAVAPWLRGFWATMAREWTTGIDVLRMEKFLLLVRRMLAVSLVWMQARAGEEEEQKQQKQQNKNKNRSPKKKATRGAVAAGTKRTADGEGKGAEVVRWNKERVEAGLVLLADWPFRPDEESRVEEDEEGLMPKFVPAGLKLHALDIWVDEAEKAGLLEMGPGEEVEKRDGQEEGETGKKATGKGQLETLSGGEVLRCINELVEKLHEEARSTAVRIRSKDSLADERLPWNKTEAGDDEEEEEDDDDGEWGGLDN